MSVASVAGLLTNPIYLFNSGIDTGESLAGTTDDVSYNGINGGVNFLNNGDSIPSGLYKIIYNIPLTFSGGGGQFYTITVPNPYIQLSLGGVDPLTTQQEINSQFGTIEISYGGGQETGVFTFEIVENILPNMTQLVNTLFSSLQVVNDSTNGQNMTFGVPSILFQKITTIPTYP